MAALTQTKRSTTAVYPLTVNTLTAADSLTYTPGSAQTLKLTNTTGSAVVVTLTGNAPGTATLTGYGTVSGAGGKAVSVPANSQVEVPLDAIALYLGGTSVAVTGGVGLTAVFTSN